MSKMNQVLALYGTTKVNGEIEADWIEKPLNLELLIVSPIASIQTVYGWVGSFTADIEIPYDAGYEFEDNAVVFNTAKNYSWKQSLDHIVSEFVKEDSTAKLTFVPCENIGGLEQASDKVNDTFKEVIAEMKKALVDEGQVSYSFKNEHLTVEAQIRPSIKGWNAEISKIVD